MLAICKTMWHTQYVKFVWDAAKNKTNFKKHGVWFETAAHIFTDMRAVKIFDAAHSVDEDRWIVIGMAQGSVLFVVETDIDDETVRIISARKANKREVEAYYGRNNIYDS
ncbi:MAG: BrnT family toxin [Treponemataceae bacterium]|nr:MAG: BrnT family toxin [Treponemataceae bacterium]